MTTAGVLNERRYHILYAAHFRRNIHNHETIELEEAVANIIFKHVQQINVLRSILGNEASSVRFSMARHEHRYYGDYWRLDTCPCQ